MKENTDFDYRFSAMSGIDAAVYIEGVRMGRLQALSFTSQREMAFNYTLGNTNPVGISKGKIGCGGTLVFLDFHRDAFEGLMTDKYVLQSKFDADLVTRIMNKGQKVLPSNEPGSITPQILIDGVNTSTDDRGFYKIQRPDQLPMFNICIVNANENGMISRRYILGAAIVNAGSSVSVDDINISSSYTYIAISITKWENIAEAAKSASHGDVTKWLTDYQSNNSI